MTDIATLGLKIDSTSAVRAKADLDNLAKSGANTQKSVTNLERAVTESGKAAEVAGRRHGQLGGSLSNLSFQINDIASGLAMGQSPFQIMAQQGGQVFQIWQMNNNVFKDAARFIGSMITPMRVLGVVGVAAAVTGALMARNWKSTELQFDDTAKSIGTTIQSLHGLEAAASFKGIDTDDFLKAAEKFGTATYDARNNIGGLADVLRANNVAVGTFEQNWASAADLIKNAGNDQARLALLQQMGLPATMQWVRYMVQGGDAIRSVAEEATKTSFATQELVDKARAFDESWNTAWKNFKSYANSATASALDGINRAIFAARRFAFTDAGLATVGKNMLKSGQGSPLSQDTGSFFPGAPGGARSGDDSVDRAALIKQISLEQQRIGVLGQLATVMETVRQAENNLRLARLQPGSQITDTDVARILEYTRAQALGTLQIRQQTESLKIETQAMGMSVGAAAAFRAEQELLADRRRRGLPDIKSETDEIHREAAALGEAAQKAAELRLQLDLRFQQAQLGRSQLDQQVAQQLRQIYGENYVNMMDSATAATIRFNETLRDTKAFSQDALSGFLKDLANGKSLTESFINVLVKMRDKLIDLATDQFLSGIFGGASKTSTSGGFLSALFGGDKSTTAAGTPLPIPLPVTVTGGVGVPGASMLPGTGNITSITPSTGLPSLAPPANMGAMAPNPANMFSGWQQPNATANPWWNPFTPTGKGIGGPFEGWQHANDNGPSFSPFNSGTGDSGSMDEFNKAISNSTSKLSDFGTSALPKFGDSLSLGTDGLKDFSSSSIAPASQALTSFADTSVVKAATETANAAATTTTMGVSATTASASLSQLSASAAAAGASMNGGGIANVSGIGNIIGMGTGGGLAGGGWVSGPGGPTEDKVPLMGSDGEFMVNARSAAKHAGLLEAINDDKPIRLPRMATGGWVRSAPRHANDDREPQPVIVKNVNVFDSASVLSEALSTREGERVHLNHVRANRGAYREALGV